MPEIQQKTITIFTIVIIIVILHISWGPSLRRITIRVDGRQPFVAGQQITGNVMFNNTLGKNMKIQKIYAEFIGEIVHPNYEITESEAYSYLPQYSFFKQIITLEEKQSGVILEKGSYSWPISFSPPTLLPPSLNQLSSGGPYVHYKIRVVFERPEKYKMNVYQRFPVHLIAHPSSYLHPSFLPVETKNKDHSDIIFHAILNNQNDVLKPGDTYLLDVELYNPKHISIKCLSIDMVKNRTLWKAGHCSLKIPLLNPPDLQEFSGEHYRETLPLVIPDDDRIIPSFRYLPSSTAEKPIAVEYVIKLEVKVHGLSKNFIQNTPVIVYAREPYIKLSNEEEILSASSDFIFEPQ